VNGLAEALAALNAQTLIYGAQDYIQPVLLGDAWVAVGWSNDLVTALGRQRSLKAVVPRSGTALWADLWVRPAKADRNSEALAALWAGLAWQPSIARDLAGWVDAAPAAWLEGDRTAMTPQVQRELLLPSPEVLCRCEFIQPLAAASIAQYQALWMAMRQPTPTP
ncbi:MAG TPA: ABC transporter substrate-binding protein, partial [Coleofasciculaceae cyanobacterium]